MIGASKIFNGSHDLTTPYQGRIVVCGLWFAHSACTSNLKSLRSPITKMYKAAQNVETEHTTSYSNLIETMRLYCTVFEISPIFPKVKEVTWQWPRPFQLQFVVLRMGLAMINMHTKFEVSSVSRSWRKPYLLAYLLTQIRMSVKVVSESRHVTNFVC